LFKERKKPDRPVWHDLSVGMAGPANQTAGLVPETRRPGEKILRARSRALRYSFPSL